MEFDGTLEKPGELNFLEHAALYAFVMTMNTCFSVSEEEGKRILAALGDAPAQDGSVQKPKRHPFESGSYELAILGNDNTLSIGVNYDW